ncbi:MAG: glycosyltransferase family 1 protein [Anaerolineales bacterium]|nr:MAG: glycosyltransferase family 1 protein [Anaerolineales bacterium]
MDNKQSRIGFVSTRLAGTDGVSLETIKWSNILTGLGHECFYFAGESDWPEERTHLVPEAHFEHPEIRTLNTNLFDNYRRSLQTSQRVQAIANHLKDHLYEFVRSFDLDLLIAENALSIPMNIPLGLALTELIAETNIPTIGHHHDFAWERGRFKVTAASDYQLGAFPPVLPSVHHVVINSYAARQLALRTGVSSMLIPNVMDFDSPPPEPDAYAADLRSAFGIGPDEYLLLQPTRVVPRKRIELAIELARRLDLECTTLVISHASGDEGTAYETYLRDYASLMGVRVLFATDVIAHHRGRTLDGRKIFSLADVYQRADLVTYPSTVEGFGNAFLETVFYRRPIVISIYEIYRRDIQPKGFKVIGFHDFITQDCVRHARDVLCDPDLAAEMADHNYELGRRHYSYRTLEKRLVALISECLGD